MTMGMKMTFGVFPAAEHYSGYRKETLPLYEQLPASPKRHLSSPENMDTILSGICCSRLWESLVKHPVKWLQSSMGLADLSVSYQPQPAASLGQMLDARIWARAIATLFSQNQAGDGGGGRGGCASKLDQE